MNYIQRGFLSIKRKPGKSIILLLLIFILGNFIMGAISIKESVKNTEESLRKKIGAIATLEVDYEKIPNNGIDFDYTQIKNITPDTLEKIGALSYVKYFDYSLNASLMSKNLKNYYSEDDGGVKPFYNITSSKAVLPSPSEQEYAYFSLTGVQNKEIFDLKQNKIKLIEGRVFTEDEIKNIVNVILVSKNFAAKNDLKIGSKIKLENIIYDYGKGMDFSSPKIAAQKLYEFEIIGIFDPIKSGNSDYDYIAEQKQNMFYASNKVVNEINVWTFNESKKLYPDDNYTEDQITNYRALFVLDDPANLDKFNEEIKDMIPEYYSVIDNSNAFKNVSGPIENMKSISNIVLYVSALVTILILSLLVTLFLRDRKHEIGIYLSLGESKKKVITQIVFEVMTIAFIAMTLSLFSGSLISGAVSKTMLKNQLIANEENKKNNWDNGENMLDWLGYGNSVTSDELSGAYSVKLTGTIILLFYAFGLGTTLLASSAPVVYITRLNPKKIMM